MVILHSDVFSHIAGGVAVDVLETPGTWGISNHIIDLFHIEQHQKRSHFNACPPGQNGQFAVGVLRCIFLNDKFCILNKISPKFVP